jgi:aerobic-type carbon monoxide dehydrogenase small subunit (CoxS/CutS family)
MLEHAMKTSIRFRVNGKDAVVQAGDGALLLWALREQLALTGTKVACGLGLCGACTVLVDGRAVRSCITPAASVAGKSVTTIEGLAQGERLHPLQQAFIDHDAFQCGYCTPGLLMAADALLRTHPRPTREQVVAGLDRHLCRCGSHTRVVDAVLDASRRTGATS